MHHNKRTHIHNTYTCKHALSMVCFVFSLLLLLLLLCMYALFRTFVRSLVCSLLSLSFSTIFVFRTKADARIHTKQKTHSFGMFRQHTNNEHTLTTTNFKNITWLELAKATRIILNCVRNGRDKKSKTVHFYSFD